MESKILQAVSRILGEDFVEEALKDGIPFESLIEASMRVAFQYALQGPHIEDLRAVINVLDEIDQEVAPRNRKTDGVPIPIYYDDRSFSWIFDKLHLRKK